MVERELTYDDRFEGSNDEVGDDEEVKGLQVVLCCIILWKVYAVCPALLT